MPPRRSHNMSFKLASVTQSALAAAITTPVAEEEEYYSSWSLFLVCMLLILSLLTSYYLQIKRIRAIHETLVSIFAGMLVGLVIRVAPGQMIREMLVSLPLFRSWRFCGHEEILYQGLTGNFLDVQTYSILQFAAASDHPELGL